MGLTERERSFLEAAPVGRLATADAEARPHVIPVCFALVEDDKGVRIHTPLDEKPKTAAPEDLRRVRDIEANPRVALIVDRYEPDWTRLGWVQVRGTATLRSPDAAGHESIVDALREKYSQYADHALETRPTIELRVGSVRSWGRLRWDA